VLCGGLEPGRRAIDSFDQSGSGRAPAAADHTVAVSGYYGCGNAGDEAVLAGIKAAFRKTAGDAVRLVALSQNPAATRSLHSIDAEYRMDMRTVRSVLSRSELLISGGGSLLQDTTSLRSLIYYLWVARMALAARKPVMFYAQGMGPLRRPAARYLVRMVADRASYITVRDEPSAQLLKEIGVRRPPIEVTADPAFALQPAAREVVDECLGATGSTATRQRIGVALRPWGGQPEAQAAEYAELLLALERRTAAQLVLIPMQLPGDADFSLAVARKAGRTYPIVDRVCSPEALLGVVGEMDAVVAMRLHTLIFAARMSVPLFALSYDPKVANLLRALDLSDCVADWTGFSAEDAAAKVGALLDDRAARRGALAVRTAELERMALRNAEVALSLIRN
jgi:polysaccharide pyruvyl transferase CsaB